MRALLAQSFRVYESRNRGPSTRRELERFVFTTDRHGYGRQGLKFWASRERGAHGRPLSARTARPPEGVGWGNDA